MTSRRYLLTTLLTSLALVVLAAAPASSGLLSSGPLSSGLLGSGLLGSGPLSSGPLSSAATAGERPFTLGGQPCRLVEVPAAAPLGLPVSCAGVRPGAAVLTPIGLCTFNFLWVGSDGRRYMGTAGHCILPAEGEMTWAPGTGPEARDSEGNRVGEFAYAVLEDPADFSLIRLDPGVEASPEMCFFGGPTGLNTDQPSLLEPVLLQQYGQGIVIGSVLPARTYLAAGMPSPDHVFATGLVLPGDSGSGVISADGRAVGVVVTTGLHLNGVDLTGADLGTVGITRLAPQLQRALNATGLSSLTLQTAPLAP